MMISPHIPYQPAQFADDVRPFVANSVEKTVGYHADKASLNEKGEVRSKRAREVETIRNHRRHASGPKMTASMKNKLNQELPRNPLLSAYLPTTTRHAVKSSVVEQVVKICQERTATHASTAAQARLQAEGGHKGLYAWIKGSELGEKKANELLGGPEFNSAIYLTPGKHERVVMPDELFRHPQLYERFFKIQDCLDEAFANSNLAEQHRELEQINLTLLETMRHPSYRFLARIVSAEMRAKMMTTLNVVGMLTMVASFPLMYVGLKQWMESLHQPHESAAQ